MQIALLGEVGTKQEIDGFVLFLQKEYLLAFLNLISSIVQAP